MSGHLSVFPGPHRHVKFESERQPLLAQNLPRIESPGNLSGTTTIEINWILGIITFMLMQIFKEDNSPGDKYLGEVGRENLQSQQERLGILEGGAAVVGVGGMRDRKL